MCSKNTVRESSHISFFCGGDPFCEVVRRPENTHEKLTGLLEWPACFSLRLSSHWISPFTWETSGSLPFVWATTGSLPSVQNYRSYIVFQVPWTRLFAHLFFCLWLVIGTNILPRTEISVTLSIGNELYSLSCETTLLMLSCDHIESAKFIVTS